MRMEPFLPVNNGAIMSLYILFSNEFDSVLERLVDAVMEQPLKSNLVEKQHLEEAVKLLNAKVCS